MKSIIIMSIFSVGSGALIAVQSGLSGQLSKTIGNPFFASFSIYFVCAILMGGYLIFNPGQFPSSSELRSVPWHLWFVGALCSCMALSTIYWLMPIIGVPKLMIGVIVGQLFVSMIAGHYGLFNLPVDQFTVKKLIGSILLILGFLFINYEGKV
jgi:transporter family-2 protein